MFETETESVANCDSDTASLVLMDGLAEVDAELDASLENDIDVEPQVVAVLDIVTDGDAEEEAESEIDGKDDSDMKGLPLAVSLMDEDDE